MTDSVTVTTQTDRRTALLDASLKLIGEGGLRAVTHRAVEQAAGAPHGSTTYYFKTRDQLIEATVERMVEIDRGRTEEIGNAIAMGLARRDSLDLDAMADAIVAWIDSAREVQLARYEIHLASARDERLKALMSAGSARFWKMVEPIAVASGSDDPPRDARMIVALLDGLILDYLTRKPADPEVIRRGLKRLLGAS
jgi:DNA-binding transcriptional regulator YbjK